VQTLVSSSHSHLKFLKLLKFLKFLKNTTRFGPHGHPQVLKFFCTEDGELFVIE
jgi:hypothetical protein